MGLDSTLDQRVKEEILLVDDHFMTRDGAIPHLKRLKPAAVVHEAGSLSEAKRALRDHPGISLVFLDLKLPDSQGLSTLAALKSEAEVLKVYPRIVIVTGDDDVDLAQQAIDQGAGGYIHKGITSQEYNRAVEDTVQGRVFMPSHVVAHLLRKDEKSYTASAVIARLTAAERLVCNRLVHGMSDKQIANSVTRDRGRSMDEHTVRSHIKKIAVKIGCPQGAKGAKVILSRFCLIGLKFPLPELAAAERDTD